MTTRVFNGQPPKRIVFRPAAPSGDGGGAATSAVKESGTLVSSAITVFDFGAGFDVTESPSGEANIALDLTEVSAATTTAQGPVELATEAEAVEGTDTERAVTSAGVAAAIAALVAAAPSTLDTLNELAAALGDDPNFATTVTTLIAAAQSTANAALPRVAAGASVENIGAVEWNVNTVASSGATETLDTSTYGTHDVTMSENCTFTFSNPAPAGKETEFKLILRGAFTPTFPASVDWPDATAPTYTTPSIYVFSTVDAGTTWFGGQVGKAFG